MNTENMPSEQETFRQELADYLVAQDPLGIGVYKLEPLPAAEYHLNFKFSHEDRTYVVRMSVLQLSRKNDQLAQEYNYLQYLSKHDVSPHVYHLDMDGYEHPFLIEEFIEGRSVH